jgi:hypothetical protein
MPKVTNDTKYVLERLSAIEQKIDAVGIRSETKGIGDWLKVLTSLSSVGASLLGLLYVCGFFVVNAYLSQYGTYTLSLLQSRYLAAGILVSITTGIIVVIEIMFTRWVKVSFWRTTIFVTSTTSIFTILLFILNDRSWISLVLAFLPFFYLLIGNLVIAIFTGGWRWGNKTDFVEIAPIRSGLGVGMMVIIFIITAFGYLYFFSQITYPLVNPEFGGGAPRSVQFYGNTTDFQDLKLYGIPLTATVQSNTMLAKNVSSFTYTIPLYMLGETSDSYIVTDARKDIALDFSRKKAFGTSFQIRKNAVAGVLYLNRADMLNPLLIVGIPLAIFIALLGFIWIIMRLLWPIATRFRKGK